MALESAEVAGFASFYKRERLPLPVCQVAHHHLTADTA